MHVSCVMPRFLYMWKRKNHNVQAGASNCWELFAVINSRLLPTLHYVRYACNPIFPRVFYRSTSSHHYIYQLHRQRGFPSAKTVHPTPPAMIGTSKPEYWFIRLCIVGLHYIAPLCVAYCILLVYIYGFKATKYRFPLLVETGALLETLFYFLVYLPYNKYLQREASHPPAPSREERKELFALCNDNIADCEGYLRKWFLGADINEIKRENLKDFLLWAFFNRGGPPGDDDEELEEYVSATEKLLGRPIEEGRGNAQPLRLTLDKVDMLHRSLIWYFVRVSLHFWKDSVSNIDTVRRIRWLPHVCQAYIPRVSVLPYFVQSVPNYLASASVCIPISTA